MNRDCKKIGDDNMRRFTKTGRGSICPRGLKYQQWKKEQRETHQVRLKLEQPVKVRSSNKLSYPSSKHQIKSIHNAKTAKTSNTTQSRVHQKPLFLHKTARKRLPTISEKPAVRRKMQKRIEVAVKHHRSTGGALKMTLSSASKSNKKFQSARMGCPVHHHSSGGALKMTLSSTSKSKKKFQSARLRRPVQDRSGCSKSNPIDEEELKSFWMSLLDA